MIVLPKYAAKQPQSNNTLRIHWGNPITNRLVSVCVPMNNFAPEPIANFINGAVTSNKLQVEPGFASNTRLANRANGDAYNWGYSYVTSTRGIVPTAFNYSQMTLFVLFEQYDTTSTGMIWGGGPSTVNSIRMFKNSDGTVNLIPNTNSSTFTAMTTPVLEIYRPYALTGIHYNTSVAEFFVDGVSVGSASDVANFLGTSYLFTGSAHTTGQTRRIGIYCAYIWTRRLAPVEIKSITNNPWQIFRNNTDTFSSQIVPALPSNRFLMFFG